MSELLEVVDVDAAIDNYLTLHGYVVPTNIVLDYTEIMQDYSLRYAWSEHTFTEIADRFLSRLRHKSGILELVPYHVRLINYTGPVSVIRNFRNTDIGKLVTFDCVIRKVSEVRQEIYYAGFVCSICGAPISPLTRVDSDLKPIQPWTVKCPIDTKHTRRGLDLSRCKYRDVQYVTVQEVQAEHGRQPKNIRMVISGPFCDKLIPGNRCRITGEINVSIEQGSIASMFVECYNIVKSEDDYSDIVVTDEDTEKIKKLARDENVFKNLANSINPSIYGYDNIKLALILQMFGGVSIDRDDGTRQRGDSHILLCGDPSMAKSQLIRSVHTISTRSVYASGRSTSGAGLTAAAIKDELDGKWTLEAGAMVLSDGGMCIIDELDKMREEDRSSLHEAMEQQTISFNKAGLSEKLNTRCAVLAACNPKTGKFDPEIPVFTQIELPPALISRFDLIFTMIDIPNKEIDKEVATHVLNMRETQSDVINRYIDIDTIRKYIVYAKQINPKLDKESRDYLCNTYISLRNGNDTYITLRQLEALERLTESSARIRLDTVANISDAKRAVELFRQSLQSVTLSDKVDVSVLFGARSVKDGKLEEMITSLCSPEMWINTSALVLKVTQLTGSTLNEVNSVLLNMVGAGKAEIRQIDEQAKVKLIR